MKWRLSLLLGVFLMLCCSVLFSEELNPLNPDAEGCKDSLLLTRMSECSIYECSGKEFDSMGIQVGPEETKNLEGKTEIVTYQCLEKKSSLQMVRNAENALLKAGYTIVFKGNDDSERPVVTARKGGQWIEIRGEAWSGYSGYTLMAVRVQEMAQEMEVTSDSLAEEINKSGRVSVYGINFDTGKSTIKPESEKILGEIAKLLNENLDWKLKVEGHTDSVGTKASNLALSKQRAASVVAWLVKHGVEKPRLTSQGFGDSKPVDNNGTQEGRAKNRRVELVKL